jgi:hypothetical protein
MGHKDHHETLQPAIQIKHRAHKPLFDLHFKHYKGQRAQAVCITYCAETSQRDGDPVETVHDLLQVKVREHAEYRQAASCNGLHHGDLQHRQQTNR